MIHHARKLQSTLSQDFDAIGFAGKSGTLLSAISVEQQLQIPQGRLEALAKANHISSKTELPTILSELARQRLVLPGTGGIEVIGLAGRTVLESTVRIFDESTHEKHEEIVIKVSDAASAFFDVALQLEAAAYAPVLVKPSAMPAMCQGVIGVLADFWGGRKVTVQ